MCWKIQKLKLALNNFFEKIRFIVETCITFSYEWRMLSVSSHCRQFQLIIFPSQVTIAAAIFHKLVAPLLKYFYLYGPVTVSIYPKTTLNQLGH